MDKFKNFTSPTGKTYDFAMILPIRKVEEQSDGTLRVWGVVTAQKPDRDKEVCNYAKTVPYYQKTMAEMLKATDVEGMEKSIMPLREMHQLKAVGKGISINFIDEERTIYMGFEVVDSETIKKVRKGVLPAFSQGGNYVGKPVKSEEFPDCMEYVANPGEVSLVDRGSLPEALIDTMKGQTFTIAKRDGSLEIVKCDADPENQLAKLSEADVERLSKSIADSILGTQSEKIDAAIAEAVRERIPAKQESEMNKEQIEKCAKALGITVEEFQKQFIDAEGAPLSKLGKGSVAALHAHLEKVHGHHIAHHEAMTKAHDAHTAHIEKAMKMCKAVMGNDGDADDAKKALKTILEEFTSPEMVSIGKTSDGVEIFRKKDSAEVKLEGVNASSDGIIKASDVQKLVADAVADALKKAKEESDKELAPNNGGTGTHLQLVGRDGKVIEKASSMKARNPMAVD